jgi:hypothetical protein
MIDRELHQAKFHRKLFRRIPMDDVKGQMEGVTRVYTELDNKISDKGGVQNLFGMNRKIRQALETITIGELDSMLVLKEVLSAPMSGKVNGATGRIEQNKPFS